MLSSDIINHLIKYLPKYTPIFNKTLSVSNILVVGDIITMVFNQNHNLATGDKISIHNATVNINIESFVNENGIIKVTTTQDHDLTNGWQDTITIQGSSIAELNGNFKLKDVPNRKTFTFEKDVIITPPIGSPILLQNYEDNNINDFHNVTEINPTTITINVQNNPYTAINIEDILVSTKIRISGGSNLERLIEAYEGSSNIEAWLFVVLDDYQTGKARSSPLDAIQNVANLNAWNIEQLANFSTHVFIPSKNEITGRVARDTAESLRYALYKTLINASFDPILTSSVPTSNVAPVLDNMAGYSKSYYIHQYQWQQVNQVTGEDVFIKQETKSFRNLKNIILNKKGSKLIDDNYNLDEKPLGN